MKAPPKRKGNTEKVLLQLRAGSLNESPSEKEGKSGARRCVCGIRGRCLNESPSEKEGKFRFALNLAQPGVHASMKAPPKRKGNAPADM